MTNEERVNKIIVEHLGVGAHRVNPDAKLLEDLDADSLDQVELVMAVEEEFLIQITDEEASKCLCVKDMYNIVNIKLS